MEEILEEEIEVVNKIDRKFLVIKTNIDYKETSEFIEVGSEEQAKSEIPFVLNFKDKNTKCYYLKENHFGCVSKNKPSVLKEIK